MPDVVVKAYETTFASELPSSCFDAVAQFYDRACTVASEHQLIVFPRASGEACLTVAYVKLKCQEAFARQFWHNSCLAKPQIKFTPKYNLTDFATWVLETMAVSFGKLFRIVPLFRTLPCVSNVLMELGLISVISLILLGFSLAQIIYKCKEEPDVLGRLGFLWFLVSMHGLRFFRF